MYLLVFDRTDNHLKAAFKVEDQALANKYAETHNGTVHQYEHNPVVRNEWRRRNAPRLAQC